jgi:glycine/D-amino acid oxidase-like deaminating enzyme
MIRYGHGLDEWHAKLAWRARHRWQEIEEESGQRLLIETGVLWLAHRQQGWESDSEATLRRLQIPVDHLTTEAAAGLYPSFAGDDIAWASLEPAAGVLRAAAAIEAMVGMARRRGARFLQGTARPLGGRVEVDGQAMGADFIVWAVGPWLGRLFPGLVELRVVRREYVTFVVDEGWSGERVPAFYEYEAPIYGMPDIDEQGLKVAPDAATCDFDPDAIDRAAVDPALLGAARSYLAKRFPALSGAAMRGGRVCQYELTRDNRFIVARHPAEPAVWLVGGGSGHGFKHGPALGDYVAEILGGGRQADQRLGLHHREPAPGLRSAAEDFLPAGP